MKKANKILSQLRLPIIVAPMFLVSGPQLVIQSCRQGVLGTLPALNARSDQILDDWLHEIRASLSNKSKHPYSVASFGVNLIVHKSNKRLQGNLKCIVDHKVPLVLTALGAASEVVDAVHDYGGVVFHDVTNIVHARKAIKAGVDGLIAVCAGAGGHAGAASPMAFIPQLRREFDGVICLAGGISDGQAVLASQSLGADVAYMGTRFIATQESLADPEYKQMIVSESIGPAPLFLPTIYTSGISGVHANFLRASLERVGIDPERIDHALHEQAKDFSKLGKNRHGKISGLQDTE
ncbi:hypothetical protein BDEG_26939 [Batrachochytrium dendrobatidis JEL423]|nr:hypothetical protein BDEG_26939 [Batrachochytrium dendrobatidis JEL423]